MPLWAADVGVQFGNGDPREQGLVVGLIMHCASLDFIRGVCVDWCSITGSLLV